MHSLRPVTEEAILLLLHDLQQPEHQLLSDQVPKPLPSMVQDNILPTTTYQIKEREERETTKLFEDANHLLTYHKSIGSHNIKRCDS